ncbi:MAG: patatin family protein [Erysipelotrichaceae bacterium]
MKTGLVLEGGGMRGAYTAGCLKWFLENNIEFDYKCAISAAALLLVYFETKDVVALEKLTEQLPKKINVGIRPLLREGQFVGYQRMIYHICKELLPLDFNKLAQGKPIEIGVYNADQDKLIWLKNQEINYPFLHASNMLPVTGRAVRINKERYFDGGIKSMFPVFRSVENDCQRTIFITTKPSSYTRKQNSKKLQFIMGILYRRYPKMLKAINDRVKVYHDEINEINNIVDRGEGLIIRPTKEVNVERLAASAESIAELFKLGYQDCEKQKVKILEMVGK